MAEKIKVEVGGETKEVEIVDPPFGAVADLQEAGGGDIRLARLMIVAIDGVAVDDCGLSEVLATITEVTAFVFAGGRAKAAPPTPAT